MTLMTSSYGSSELALYWLPPIEDFDAVLREAAENIGSAEGAFARLQHLANHRLDFMQTGRLDRLLSRRSGDLPERGPHLKLALVGSSTLDHLPPGIRVGALRRGLLVETYTGGYGQWRQEILDPASPLRVWQPDAVLLSLEPSALVPDLPVGTTAAEVDAAVEDAAQELVSLWRKLRDDANVAVIQQTFWGNELSVFGHLDRLVPASPASVAARLDSEIQRAAAEEGVLLLDMRQLAVVKGIDQLSDPMLWHHAKQAISPAAVPWLGDHIARLLAALRGLSKKVVVLDLDNTLWGGVIGDDGLEGIVLGQGSGSGEAYVAFQHYLKRLHSRGVLLAVSSKNDQAIAESAFIQHAEMVLRREDIAAFEANWNDKPSALRRIAQDLNLGLDSLVFVDDNPAERDLVRRTLPAVAVPELPEGPELYARCLSDAGYFEAVSFTADDVKRNAQYAANRERRKLQSSATNIEEFLRDLQMTLTVTAFQPADLPRITQLINKTNQFNLTTRRYTESEVRAMMGDPTLLTFAGRLADRFGDNGLTTLLIGRLTADGNETVCEIDTWLMSCRILGRQVEHAMLTLLAEEARIAGTARLLGRYRPTAKNGLVREHYPNLGFVPFGEAGPQGETDWVFDLTTARLPKADHMTVVFRR